MEWYRRLVTFLGEVMAELKRTTWPKWIEVRGTTTVVIITLFIFALFLWVVDLGLAKVYRETMKMFR